MTERIMEEGGSTIRPVSGGDCSHALLKECPLERLTQAPASSAFPRGNAALPSDSLASSSLFGFNVVSEGEQKDTNLQHQSYQNGFQFPSSHAYGIKRSSPIMEKVIVPVTPDKCKRSGGDRIREGDRIDKGDPVSVRMGSVERICFGQCNSEPANISYVGIPSQSDSHYQGKTINCRVDLSSHNSCQLGPATPDRFKGTQSYQLVEVNVEVSKETGKCRDNNIVPSCKETVEICLNECTSQQSYLPNFNFPQQHNLPQEIQCSEMSKTPSQKTTRKRHRPKVVIEGRQARKPKQTTPKSVKSPHDPPPKKRSVRKKETSSMENPPYEIGHIVEPQKPVRNSVRKSLNFEDLVEVHVADGNQTPIWCSKYETELCCKACDNNNQNESISSDNTAFNHEHLLQNQHRISCLEEKVVFPQHSTKQTKENMKKLARMNKHHKPDVSNDNQMHFVSEIHGRRTDNRQNKFAVPLVRPDALQNFDTMHAMSHKMDAHCTNDCSHMQLVSNNSLHGTERCMDSIPTPLKVPRKKRTKKERKSTSFHGTAYSSLSSSVMRLPVDHIDVITQMLQHLNISKSSGGTALQHVQNNDALVIYTGGGAVVPFEGYFTPRKQKPRAKVDLDSETNRVWMLLMGKNNGSFPEETDIDKEKWWEGERKVFRGRVDSFIARMHLVQGDRRFSKWKGSVVDSVIGVFLTQNVSDHLSSSAFMSLAARFPKFSGNECIPNAINQEISKESVVISILECSDDGKSQEDRNSKQRTGQSSTVYHEPQNKEKIKIGMFSYSEDSALPESRMELDSIDSSQNSVVSSQHPSKSSVPVFSSEKIPPTEILETRNFLSGSHFTASFTEILQMAESRALKEIDESQFSLSICDGFEYRSLGLDHLKKLDGDISINQSIFDHSPQQHYQAEGACGPTGPHLFSAQETELAIIHNFEIMQENSSLSSITSEGTSTHDAVKACPIDGHWEKNTSKYHVEEKSVCTDPNMVLRNLSFQPFSCSNIDAYGQTHSSNCNYIPREKTKSSANKKGFIMLHGNREKIKHDEKEINIYAKDTFVETNSWARKVNHEEQNSQLDQHSQPSISCITESPCFMDKHKNMPLVAHESTIENTINLEAVKEVRKQKSETQKKQRDPFDWDSLRREALSNGVKQERSVDTVDSVDWEAVRHADVSEVAHTIRERGMNNKLAARIKEFLDRLDRDHGSIDLEWLRDLPPDKVKDYLLSIQGLGLKSVECVRLLTLEHLAFPVDTNVGRICVRLGWVPIQPLPESLQLHLLELYPMLETIQKYLWPRLCMLDQRTLYELHYQMITFGKVFCTKSRPNCNACPMRGECKHFASAFASARLALPGPEDKSLVSSNVPDWGYQIPAALSSQEPFLQLEGNSVPQGHNISNCEPIIEEPATPEPQDVEAPENAIEDAFYEDSDEIPTIKLNVEQFTQNLQTILQENSELQDGGISKALVALTPEAASIPQPKLKNINRLRTEHQVYELPDGHPLLNGMEQREPDDPCPYLLAIWTPGETAQSTESPETSCSSCLSGKLCESITCFSCNSIKEAEACKVRGTLLIPCRTAMRGSFPLNGTYFQVNEVFADHCSSISPLDVPRKLIWNLPRRMVYFGTSVPTIFRGLTTEGIQQCFWKGFVCVRGFDQKTRAPRPLLARLHFPASKTMKYNRKTTPKEAN